MAFTDYIWLIKLIIELLKVLGRLDKPGFEEVARGVQRIREIVD